MIAGMWWVRVGRSGARWVYKHVNFAETLRKLCGDSAHTERKIVDYKKKPVDYNKAAEKGAGCALLVLVLFFLGCLVLEILK